MVANVEIKKNLYCTRVIQNIQVNMTQYNCRIEVFVDKHFCSKPPASTSTVLLPQRLPSAAEVNQM